MGAIVDLPSPIEMQAVIAVAEMGSFTAAAQRLGVAKTSVGRAICNVERRLGVALFHRTTRAVRLTSEGMRYCKNVMMAMEILSAAEDDVISATRQTAGLLKIEFPAGLGHMLMTRIDKFLTINPEIRLEIGLSDQYSSIIADGWDIVFRVGELKDSSLKYKRICKLRYGLFASPEYVVRHGAPKKIDDLLSHRHIALRTNSGKIKPWDLTDDGKTISFEPIPTLVVRSSAGLIEAVKSNIGIAYCFDATISSSISSGEAIEILADASLDGPDLNAVYPGTNRELPAKARSIIDYITKELRSVGKKA